MTYDGKSGLFVSGLAIAAALGIAIVGAGQALRPDAGSQAEVEKIVAFLAADSFLEAAKLADDRLAAGRIEAEAEAVCGLAVLLSGRIEAGEKILLRAAAREPENPEAQYGLGRLARIRNDADAAVALLRRGLESRWFYEQACRQLWRTIYGCGSMAEIREVSGLVTARFRREGYPAPSWLTNNLAQLEDYSGTQLFRMEAAPDHVAVPLLRREGVRIRMVSMRINGKGEYPFDIDSASADFLTVSPLLAEDLGLRTSGSSQAFGVGSGTAGVRFARLDRVEMAGIVFRDVPVMVSDLHVFRGVKRGLLGTALLKRFNVAIDVRAGVMDLYALDKPELLRAVIDKGAVAADVPLYLFDATMVRASTAGAPEGLYILDSAAATNLVDAPFFREHIKPRLDPSRIVAAGIQGATGVQSVNQVNGLEIRLGGLAFTGQQANEFSMAVLNSISGRYAAGLLGNPLLWPYRVRMDFKACRLILERYPAL